MYVIYIYALCEYIYIYIYIYIYYFWHIPLSQTIVNQHQFDYNMLSLAFGTESDTKFEEKMTQVW